MPWLLRWSKSSKSYTSRVLTAGQCRQRLPAVRADYCAGGLLFEQEVTAEPDQLIHRLLAYLVERWSLDYRPATPVREVTANATGCEVVDAHGQRYSAAQVLVCSGRDFKFLFPKIFAQSDLQLCKLQMLATYPLPQVQLPGSILTGLSIRRYPAFHACPSYAQLRPEDVDPELRQWGIHLRFKQAANGSIIIGDTHEYADLTAADELDFNNSDELNQLMLREARRILDLPDWCMQRALTIGWPIANRIWGQVPGLFFSLGSSFSLNMPFRLGKQKFVAFCKRTL